MPEDNPREELYDRFRKSLSQPVSDRYFDEDELVEIYDYAGDISDDYVQLEALFCGARLYPQSVVLAERRALMYLDTSVDDSDEPTPAAGAFLADNPEIQTPIFEIARLEVNRPSDPVPALEFLLSQYNSFSDEEIIRFVDLAFDLDCYDWVITNLPRLRQKVSFQPALVYEVLQEADETGDNDTVISLSEELIEHEPFAVGYWVTLFKGQARAGKQEEARSTFDYAKALGTDNPDALLVLTDTVYNFAPYLNNEALEIVDRLIEETPDEFMYVDCKCALLARMGSVTGAVDILKTYLARNPGHSRAMRQLLLCNAPGTSEYLDMFYAATGGAGFDDATYAELVTMLSLNGAHRTLNDLIGRNANPAQMEANDLCAWVEALYALGNYDKVIEVVEAVPEKDIFVTVPVKGVPVIFAYIVALMKAGRGADAEACLAAARPALESILEEAPMAVRMIVRQIFTLADKMRLHKCDDTLYWQYFDMLKYGKL